LHEKSEALPTFKSFKIRVEKEAGTFITCHRTDRGGEFTSKEFSDFCTQEGISKQVTAAYTPRQNGITEWKNRTIMNIVLVILHEKQVPKPLWPRSSTMVCVCSK